MFADADSELTPGDGVHVIRMPEHYGALSPILHVLPLVDQGHLRGLVTRANMLRMGHFVLRKQDPDEFNFFVNRLRVRDVMVRNPATVCEEDTMEECLRRGRELGVAQFPVLSGHTLVGIISANEIFQLAAHCLSRWQDHALIPTQ